MTAKKRSLGPPAPAPATARFFTSSDGFRQWLERHHGRATELWIGFHRKDSGRRGLDYSDAVDVALCFGWIDGLRRKRDETTYTNRFTPRKPGSIWSRINIARVERLIAAGLMHPAGMAAYEKRDAKKSGIYSFEQRPERFTPALEARFRAERAAWAHFSAQPPGYKRLGMWWVLSAKREETQLRRLQQLIDASKRGQRVGVLFGQTGPKTSGPQDPRTSRPRPPAPRPKPRTRR